MKRKILTRTKSCCTSKNDIHTGRESFTKMTSSFVYVDEGKSESCCRWIAVHHVSGKGGDVWAVAATRISDGLIPAGTRPYPRPSSFRDSQCPLSRLPTASALSGAWTIVVVYVGRLYPRLFPYELMRLWFRSK